MKQRQFIATVLAAAVSPLVMGHAVAQELSFQPRVSLGYQSYNLEFEGADDDFDFDYVLGGVGLTVQRDRFFFDLYGQTNLNEAEYNENNLDGTGVDLDSTIDRYEVNATLGYAITQNVSVFGGAKYANNTLDAEFSSGAAQIDIKNDTDYIGPFAGASYAIPIADIGAIAVSGSVAYLFGEVDLDVTVSDGINSASASDKLDGTALGFNLGAAWIGNLAPLSPSLANLGYTVGVDYSQYDFEDGGDDILSEETLRGKVDLKFNF